MSDRLEPILAELKRAESVLISSHIAPDPDAVGSSCGLALGLRALGIPAEVYLHDGVPRRMLGLTEAIDVYSSELPEEKFSVVVAIDCATKRRLGPHHDALFALAPVTINIDHHVSNERYGKMNYIDSKTASASELTLRILRALECPMTPEIATLLYAGVLDDTGSFRFGNVTAETLRNAADLVSAGAVVETISNQLYYEVPIRMFRLRALTLAEMRPALQGRLSLAVITQGMLDTAGATAEDTDGIVDELRMLEGSICAVLIRQLEKGWKVSLRAKDASVDMNRVAGMFGGGGHRAAAGCTLQGAIEDVERQIVEAVGTEFSGLS
ncbi:MAG: DHH family phosphoesterase [Deltaproteobacteria bacterium]|nr:DHH family phosphoesterase [Deltaproteobacteria bacterium]